MKWFLPVLLLISCGPSVPKDQKSTAVSVPTATVTGGSWPALLDPFLKYPSSKKDEGYVLKIKLQNPDPFSEDSFIQYLMGLKEMGRVVPSTLFTIQIETAGNGGAYFRATLLRPDWESYANGEISGPEWLRRLGVETVESLESIKNKVRLARSKDLLLKWLVLEPNSTVALSLLGNVYRDEKKYPEAIEVYQKILTMDPKSVFALHNLGTVLLEEGMTADAIANYTKALEIKPADPLLTRLLANACQRNGDLVNAKIWIDKSLGLQEGPEGHLIEGNINRDGKKFKEAGEAYSRAAALAPDDNRILFNQILIDLDQKNFDEAKKKFKDLQGKDPSMAEELKIVSIFNE